jgi:hypothetical protein
LRSRSFADLRWDLRYLLETYDDDWYRSLFPADKVSGEITPAYSLLDEPDIAAVADLLPGIKVFPRPRPRSTCAPRA